MISYETEPSRYNHWKLGFDGPLALLTLDVNEDKGLVPGYKLKLNSYDLGVDIELNDALNRIRFEHPEVKAVVLTSGKSRMFCSGANIYMLGHSSHAWKVNFCKFTNETRNGIEDASQSSGLKFIAALNGTTAGGGYELALACDEIAMIDDRSSTVSLPELPLLGVLPGTGGLTRLVDKRHVRRDLADFFSTRSEGVGGQRAVQWRLADEAVPRSAWNETVAQRAAAFADRSPRPAGAQGIVLAPLDRTRTDGGVRYRHVEAVLDRARGVVEITVRGPGDEPPSDAAGIEAQAADFWPLAMTRELDDLILDLRTNEAELGTWVMRTRGDAERVLAYDALLLEHASDWLANEIALYLKRTLKRLDVTSRSIIALIEPGSCFAGSLLELVLAADRSFQLSGVFEDVDPDAAPAAVTIGPMNLGPLPMGNGLTRLATRFYGDGEGLKAAAAAEGKPLAASDAERLGLVTFTPDDLDWEQEVRIALEERASFSPDALTGLEANYRFAGPETLETKIFGRLTAWQNWVFQRLNATGAEGSLQRYGSGQRPNYDMERT